LESSKFSPITTALLKDNAIFDYATEYYYTHQLTDWKGFEFSETDFQNFLQFLKKKNFSYETETEKKFAEALRRAEDDELKDGIQSSYNVLMASIEAAKEKDLVAKKVEIKSLLNDEILKRYFYAKGLYDYQIQHNPEILEAVSVLNDANKYNRILK
ncbi:MAG TPA: peptidase S41, partial [Flavobacteriaceae bacterium]|nr:peptidase S41 [Flavobacteriaceae bacterium]